MDSSLPLSARRSKLDMENASGSSSRGNTRVHHVRITRARLASAAISRTLSPRKEGNDGYVAYVEGVKVEKYPRKRDDATVQRFSPYLLGIRFYEESTYFAYLLADVFHLPGDRCARTRYTNPHEVCRWKGLRNGDVPFSERTTEIGSANEGGSKRGERREEGGMTKGRSCGSLGLEKPARAFDDGRRPGRISQAKQPGGRYAGAAYSLDREKFIRTRLVPYVPGAVTTYSNDVLFALQIIHRSRSPSLVPS